MSLASDLLAVLNHFRVRVAERVNSGQLLTVDQHVQRLATAAETDVQRAEAEAHTVLDELYTALHTTTSGASPAAAEPAAAAPVAPAEPPVSELTPAPAAPAAPAGGTTAAKLATAG